MMMWNVDSSHSMSSLTPSSVNSLACSESLVYSSQQDKALCSYNDAFATRSQVETDDEADNQDPQLPHPRDPILAHLERSIG